MATTPRERAPRDYDDIPGTYVFDAQRSRQGYPLNMFCMSLNDADNRDAYMADPEAYLDQHPRMTPEQRDAVLRRDWLEMLQLGGNIYYMFKVALMDGMKRPSQEMGGQMTGVSFEEFCEMMDEGGRPVDGNRYTHEWEARSDG